VIGERLLGERGFAEREIEQPRSYERLVEAEPSNRGQRGDEPLAPGAEGRRVVEPDVVLVRDPQ
jgi:hypothetical protein